MENNTFGCISYISFEERKKIEALTKEGKSKQEICNLLGRSLTALVHEYKRCPKGQYSAVEAHKEAERRHLRKVVGIENPFNEHQLDILKDLMAKGVSRSKIRFALNCSYSKLDKWLQKNDPLYKGGDFNNLEVRLSNIEQQIEILFELVKGK